MHRSLFRYALLLLLGACHDSTAPEIGHPAGTLLSLITGLDGTPIGVRVMPSGDVLLTEQSSNRVVRIDPSVATRSAVGVATGPVDVVVNHAGTVAFASCRPDSAIDVIDLTRFQVVAGIRLPERGASRVALSPDDARLFATTRNSVHVLSTAGGKLERVAFNASGSRAYVSDATGQLLVFE